MIYQNRFYCNLIFRYCIVFETCITTVKPFFVDLIIFLSYLLKTSKINLSLKSTNDFLRGLVYKLFLPNRLIYDVTDKIHFHCKGTVLDTLTKSIVATKNIIKSCKTSMNNILVDLVCIKAVLELDTSYI